MVKILLRSSNDVRKKIAEAGFTQTEFSSEIGVSPKYLSAILCERKSPSPKLAKNIACHLHVVPSDIFNYRVQYCKSK